MRGITTTVLIVLTLSLQPSGFVAAMDDQDIEETPYFSFDNELFCTFIKSDNKDKIGKKFAIIDLHKDIPHLLYESGGLTYMKKVYEDQYTLTLQFSPFGGGEIVSLIGGVEVVVLNKENGHFSRISAGNLTNIYAYAAVGVCK